MYAVEAIMRGLAERLAPEDVEYWGIVGLLHDLDEETCDWKNDMSTHGPVSGDILRKEGYDDQVLIDAICAHNPESGVIAHTTLQYAILAADPMSGFVKAVARFIRIKSWPALSQSPSRSAQRNSFRKGCQPSVHDGH